MEKKKITISVALAVYNEATNLRMCLDSVKGFADEIVVVDGGSTDDTVKIAQTFGAIIIKTDNPPIFHINKQKAIDACHGVWILQMDADEAVSGKLAEEVKSITKDVNPDVVGYYIPRKNYFLKHWMRKGGQYPDRVIRLFVNGKGRLPCKDVHEQIEIEGKTGVTEGWLEHYTYQTMNDYWRKADSYTNLTADFMKKSGVKKTFKTWFIYTIQKPFVTFFLLFFRHKGFVDGWYGFLFALYSGMHFQIAYRKFTELK